MSATLRTLRGDATQQQIAELSGLDQGHISNLEQGKVDNPALGTLQALAKAYGVSLSRVIAAHAQSVKQREEAAA